MKHEEMLKLHHEIIHSPGTLEEARKNPKAFTRK